MRRLRQGRRLAGNKVRMRVGQYSAKGKHIFFNSFALRKAQMQIGSGPYPKDVVNRKESNRDTLEDHKNLMMLAQCVESIHQSCDQIN